MYDIKRLVHGNHVTVGEVIEQLEKLPKDAEFTCCGDEYLFIHVEEDNSVVTLDNEILCEVGAYPEEVLDVFPNDDEVPRFGGSLHRNMVQVRYCPTETEKARCEEHGYDLREGFMYWMTEEDYNTEAFIVDIYAGVFVENGPVGTVTRECLKTTGNKYFYKDYVLAREDENHEINESKSE